MGLNWVRLDAQWPQNPKFLILVEDKKWRAITVYMGGLAWAGAQGQAGFIPNYALPMIHGTKREAQDREARRARVRAFVRQGQGRPRGAGSEERCDEPAVWVLTWTANHGRSFRCVTLSCLGCYVQITAHLRGHGPCRDAFTITAVEL